VRLHGRTLRVEIGPDATTYELGEGPPLRIGHFDDELVLRPGRQSARTPPLADPGPRPAQPDGRAPRPFETALRAEA
jgi:alpha,alpha-trehalose phosphorylase